MQIHLGRTRQRVAGLGAELGDTEQVAWCTEEPVEAPDETTRILNFVTCSLCIGVWRVDHNPELLVAETPTTDEQDEANPYYTADGEMTEHGTDMMVQHSIEGL